MYCSFCGSDEHTQRNCPRTCSGQMNRLHMYCGYCGSNEHDVEACPHTFSGNAARAFHPDSVEEHFVKDRKK